VTQGLVGPCANVVGIARETEKNRVDRRLLARRLKSAFLLAFCIGGIAASSCGWINLPGGPPVAASAWQPVKTWPDPTVGLLARFNAASAKSPEVARFQPTGLRRADYLKLIASEVDFWKGHQNATGAIIDPYRKREVQYSTPAFTHAAAALVAYAGRDDLTEPAAKAMDWAVQSLSERRGADHHEDFYPPMLAHAFRLLKPRVAADRAARWEKQIRGIDPAGTYRMAQGGNNWNVVALSGEAILQEMGLRSASDAFVVNSLGGQGKNFGSQYGLYLEGPMAYDHFPRMWAADMLARGYDGQFHEELAEVLRRAAVTSLFMQSPWGELPAGGRSAHHQWNEAEQCVTYEIYAAQAMKDKDQERAGIFKRAAHLSLSSMFRWVRPSGEMAIVKNRVDPRDQFAFESYSSHSQYNLLPMSMLAIAYEHAESSETAAERPAPADMGGYVLSLPELHKVFANVGGTYVEIDTNGDHHYDATGLIRVHMKGVSPQLGPSDSVLAKSSYKRPFYGPSTPTTGVGISWQDAESGGHWRRLGGLNASDLKDMPQVTIREETARRAAFDVAYEGTPGGTAGIVEHYVVMPGRVELTTEVKGYKGPLRYVWPVLASDGEKQNLIQVEPKRSVSVSQDGGKTRQTFTAVGATAVRVEPEIYPNHNGWARLAVAEFPAGQRQVTLIIATRTDGPVAALPVRRAAKSEPKGRGIPNARTNR
jgi:hypothetical protein